MELGTMTLNKIFLSTLKGAGVLIFSSLSASAAIVCSDNVCWHTPEAYVYPPDRIYEDTWKPGPDIKFREHKGRGYWSDDVWTEF
jgi:hypothetical protein